MQDNIFIDIKTERLFDGQNAYHDKHDKRFFV